MLEYTSQPYLEAMAMSPSVTYTPCNTSSRKQNGCIITFAQFEEGNILTKNRSNIESSDESDDDSIVPPQLSEEEMDTMYSGNESDHDLMSLEMLENIHDRRQSHPKVNQR